MLLYRQLDTPSLSARPMTTGSMAGNNNANNNGGAKKLDELDMILGIGSGPTNNNTTGPVSAPKVQYNTLL